jgi:hypothetical protein
VESDDITFVMNGQSFNITVARAVLISPAIHSALRFDQNSRTSVIADNEIESNDFATFLEFLDSRSPVT